MADFQPLKSPDNYQKHQERPAYIKTAESLWVWPQTWKAIFDTKKWVATILVVWDTKKETQKLKDWLTLDELYDREIAWIDKKFSIENLNYIFKSEYRRAFLVSWLKDYWWKLDENNNIILWNKLIQKWTQEYNSIMEKALNDLRIVYRALLIDAKERKSEIILEK